MKCTSSSIRMRKSGCYIEEVIEKASPFLAVLALTQWDKIELLRLVKLQVDAEIKATV